MVAALAAVAFLAASPQAELTALVEEFLAGASRNDAAVHERFWADDLIYTGSSGRRVGKADILKDVKGAPPPQPGDPEVAFTAEEIRVQPYKDTAVVAFRLVGTTSESGRTSVQKYLNTGTFVKRKGEWRAVAWQATKLPRPADEAKAQVADAEKALHAAMKAADAGALDALLDDTFVWIHRTGEPLTKAQLIDALVSGRLKYGQLETSDVGIEVYGDAAVARGRSKRQREGDAEPFTSFFTLTFAHQGGDWRAVAMHSHRPQEY
jgi:ketosteroid isomerase-like protein